MATENKPRAHASVWASKDGTVTLYLSGYGLTSSVALTPDEANELVKNLGIAIGELPRAALAADLGLEAA